MKTGLEKWRIRQAWDSFSYLDEPRSYYDREKKDVIMLDPGTGKNTKRRYTKKVKEI
jgi:hypothetical protein